MTADVHGKTSRAFVSQGTISFAGKLVSLAMNVLLARLLVPEDYGLFTIALVVTNLVQLLSSFGFQSYLIQTQTLEPKTADICFTLNQILCFALGAGVIATAWLWPEPPDGLRPMLMLYGVQIALSAVSYIPVALLKRELEFGKSARSELVFTAVSMTGRVVFAAANLGALCFPLGDLLGTVCRNFYVRRVQPMSLRWVYPRLAEMRDVLWFGVHATSVGFASFTANQTDKLLLIGSFPVSQIGLYTFGNTNSSLFYKGFVVPQTSVFISAFARRRDDLERARDLVLSSSRMIFSLSIPVHALLILETENIVRLVFTEKWLAAVPLMQIFAVDFIFRSTTGGMTGIQIAFGLAKQAAVTKWKNASIFVVVLCAAAIIGVDLQGYAIAYVFANALATLHNMFMNGRVIEMRWLEFAGNLAMPVSIVLLSTLCWWLAKTYAATDSLLTGFALQMCAWLVPYFVLSLIFNRRVFDRVYLALARRI